MKAFARWAVKSEPNIKAAEWAEPHSHKAVGRQADPYSYFDISCATKLRLLFGKKTGNLVFTNTQLFGVSRGFLLISFRCVHTLNI